MNDEDFLRTLLTEHLPDPPASARTVPAGLRRRAHARTAAAVVVVVVLGIVLTTTLVFGRPGGEPADNPPPVDPFAAAFTKEWSWASVTRDDRTIVVPYVGNTCDRGELELRARELPDRVLVGLVYATPPGPKPLPCAPEMTTMTQQITLAKPLAGRTVIDAITNEPRQIIKQGSIPLPQHPPGTGDVRVDSSQVPDAGGSQVWRYTAVWGGAQLDLQFNTKDLYSDGATPYRQFAVRGNTAYFHATPTADNPPLANSCGLHWTENGYHVTLFYSSDSYVAVDTMIQQVLDIANDMR